MKERKRRDFNKEAGFASASSKGGKSSSRFFLLFAICFFVLVVTIGFSNIRLHEVFHPVLRSAWPMTESRVISTDLSDPKPYSQHVNPYSIRVNHAVLLPDQIVLVTNHDSLLAIPNPDFLKCQYTPPDPSHSSPHLSTKAKLNLPPLSLSSSLVRCPLGPQGVSLSLSTSPNSLHQPYQWDHLAYAALFDSLDNSTVVFAKGFNLRSARMSDPSRYQCVFGRDPKTNDLIVSSVITAAQEIFRCKTPITVLTRYLHNRADLPLVSIRTKGRDTITLPSVAWPEILKPYQLTRKKKKKKHSMCVCTMVRNQARFLREWVIYHSQIGVERWLIYDNNSDDKIEQVVNSLGRSNYNITLHQWPWVKTQEAGFAHCALRARGECEWVGFIDVDEFFYFPNDLTIKDVLKNYTNQPWVGELRTDCHNFGPSGHKKAPKKGVIMGYTCRAVAPERHKSIIRPDALNKSLINVVHHFHLRDGMTFLNVGQGVMLINHYKYQAWEVFKEKFYRRVATYVADWQDEENVGSKDRAPGLGTKPIEPPDWPYRFCEVNDTGLRDWVVRFLKDPETGKLPWQSDLI